MREEKHKPKICLSCKLPESEVDELILNCLCNACLANLECSIENGSTENNLVDSSSSERCFFCDANSKESILFGGPAASVCQSCTKLCRKVQILRTNGVHIGSDLIVDEKCSFCSNSATKGALFAQGPGVRICMDCTEETTNGQVTTNIREKVFSSGPCSFCGERFRMAKTSAVNDRIQICQKCVNDCRENIIGMSARAQRRACSHCHNQDELLEYEDLCKQCLTGWWEEKGTLEKHQIEQARNFAERIGDLSMTEVLILKGQLKIIDLFNSVTSLLKRSPD